MPADDDVRQLRGPQRFGDRPRHRVGAAQDRDVGKGDAAFGQTAGLACDGVALDRAIGASPDLDCTARRPGAQLLGQALAVVGDQGRGGGHYPA